MHSVMVRGVSLNLLNLQCQSTFSAKRAPIYEIGV